MRDLEILLTGILYEKGYRGRKDLAWRCRSKTFAYVRKFPDWPLAFSAGESTEKKR
jgi:hypothetical protein